jgi:hypothetical protein
MDTSLQFSASIRIQGNELLLDYQVSNPTSRDAYLLNRLYRTTPEWTMSPDVIYVHLDRAAGTIWLNKKLADLPKDIYITSPVAPYVTPLRAGGTFREQVHIPLPVHEYLQYPLPAPRKEPEPEKREPEVRTFKQVYFTLGFYWRPDGTIEETRDIQGTPVVLPKTPPGKPLEFGELTTPHIRVDIPVQLDSDGT